MKLSKKLLTIVLALLLALAVCGAVLAESGEKTDESTGDAGDTTTVGAITETEGAAAPASNLQVVLLALDGNGDPVKTPGASSCMGGTTLYVDHNYMIRAQYYDPSTRELVETDDQLILGFESEADYITQNGNTLRLAAAPKPYSFTITVADPNSAEGQVTYPASVTRFNVNLLEMLIGLAGIYLIVNALRSNSSFTNDEFIKEEKKTSFRRAVRTLAIIAGIALIIAAVLAIFFSYKDGVAIVRYVLLGVAFASLIGMAVVNATMTDREKRAKAQQGMHAPVNSSAAFEFDGSEPTIDEVLAGENNKDAE